MEWEFAAASCFLFVRKLLPAFLRFTATIKYTSSSCVSFLKKIARSYFPENLPHTCTKLPWILDLHTTRRLLWLLKTWGNTNCLFTTVLFYCQYAKRRVIHFVQTAFKQTRKRAPGTILRMILAQTRAWPVLLACWGSSTCPVIGEEINSSQKAWKVYIYRFFSQNKTKQKWQLFWFRSHKKIILLACLRSKNMCLVRLHTKVERTERRTVKCAWYASFLPFFFFVALCKRDCVLSPLRVRHFEDRHVNGVNTVHVAETMKYSVI